MTNFICGLAAEYDTSAVSAHEICMAMLQALAKGNTVKAVKCLRMELAPLQVDTMQLHKLANAIMCQDEEDLQKVMEWGGPENGSRLKLLNHLQVCAAFAESRKIATCHNTACMQFQQKMEN